MKIGLLNIGNTHSEICDYELSRRKKARTSDLVSYTDLFLEYSDIYIASVVAGTVDSLIKQYPNIKFHKLTFDKVSSVDFSKVEASSLGADRLANIVAARSLYNGCVLVVDCGTCVTVELLFDEEFLGGLIMPGRSLQRKALSLFTSQLPEVDYSEPLIEIGCNTKDAISVGTDNVSLLGLHAWIESAIEKHYGVRVCFTGGDYEFYINNASFEYSVKADLTLEGLQVFADGNS